MAEKKIKPIVVANWKLHPEEPERARELFLAVKRHAAKCPRVSLVILPPAPYLALLTPYLKPVAGRRSSVALGGQDAFWETSGAFTGQVSPVMFKNLGLEYLLVGHSERRAFGDDAASVNRKVRAGLKAGLKVILCVGERVRDTQGTYLQTVANQLTSALEGMPRAAWGNLIIAYEPLWAISTARQTPDTPADFLEQALFIRKVLSGLAGASTALGLPVLYGGSVNAANAAGFLSAGASGLLVGRASLTAEEFNPILTLAQNQS